MAGVRPPPLLPPRPAAPLVPAQRVADRGPPDLGPTRLGPVDGVHGLRRRRAPRRGLGGEPDPDVAGVAVGRPRRRGLARGRAGDVRAPARRLARGERAGLAVDDGDRQQQGVRVQPLAGPEAGAPALPALPAARRLPDRGVARGGAGPRARPRRPHPGTGPGRPGRGRGRGWRGRLADGRVAGGRRPGAGGRRHPAGGVRLRRAAARQAPAVGQAAGVPGPDPRRARRAARAGGAPGRRRRRARRPAAGGDLDPGARAGTSVRPALQPVEVHPWPWLARPRPASVGSYTAWRRDLKV